jgi:hypothetical protein
MQHPLGVNQYLNEASRMACGKDGASKKLIYQEHLRNIPRHFSGYEAEFATHFFSSAIEKLSPKPAAKP